MSQNIEASVPDTARLEMQGSRLIGEGYLARKPQWTQGEISPRDSSFLSGLVQNLAPRRSVEIGVASGWSSSVLLTSLHEARGKDFHLSAVDLSENFYLDNSIPTGAVVSQMEPGLRDNYSLFTGKYAFEAMQEIGEVDFGFIDAHHMHPWPTLDLIALLPFIRQGTWVAMHDLNLCRYERHNHSNRGPFYLYYMWPDAKICSSERPSMIGAVRMDSNPADYLPFILEILCTSWEVKVEPGALGRLLDFIGEQFGFEWYKKFSAVCHSENNKVMQRALATQKDLNAFKGSVKSDMTRLSSDVERLSNEVSELTNALRVIWSEVNAAHPFWRFLSRSAKKMLGVQQ